MQTAPRLFINLRFERCLERLAGIIGPQEIGVTDEEALLVVIGINESAGDPLRARGAHFARLWMEDIYAVDLDLNES